MEILRHRRIVNTFISADVGKTRTELQRDTLLPLIKVSDAFELQRDALLPLIKVSDAFEHKRIHRIIIALLQ